MKNVPTIALLLMLACATSLASAQTQSTQTTPSPANFIQHRVSHLTTQLSLTPEQQQQATTIFTQETTAMSGMRSQMKTARQSLQTAVQKNDAASINQLSGVIGALMAKQILAHATARAAFLQTLTTDQQTKLTQLQSQHRGRGFGRMGFGPMGF